MINRFLNLLFGCRHANCTFPQTAHCRRKNDPSEPKTYVVCLECGKEFPYDWRQMRRTLPRIVAVVSLLAIACCMWAVSQDMEQNADPILTAHGCYAPESECK